MAQRGALEVTVNWLYVIIAGGAFLIIAYAIAVQAGVFGSLKAAQDITYSIDSAVQGVAGSTTHIGTLAHEVPRFTVTVSEGRSAIEHRGSTSLSRAYLFARAPLRGEVSYWIFPFSVLYPSASYVFLTDSTQTHPLYLDGNPESDALKSYVESFFPSNIDRMGVSFAYGPPVNGAVCLGFDHANCRSIRAYEQGGVWHPSYGTVSFEGGTEPYYGAAMLLSALFAPDAEHYARVSRNALLRHGLVAEMAAEDMRTRSGDTACRSRYLLMADAISSYARLEQLPDVDAVASVHLEAETSMNLWSDELRARGCRW